jgi:hypothetical protein
LSAKSCVLFCTSADPDSSPSQSNRVGHSWF